jgi:hypothetical protein
MHNFRVRRNRIKAFGTWNCLDLAQPDLRLSWLQVCEIMLEGMPESPEIAGIATRLCNKNYV